MSAIDPELEEYMEDVISHCTHVHALASTSGYGGKALSRIKAEPFAPTSPFQSRCQKCRTSMTAAVNATKSYVAIWSVNDVAKNGNVVHGARREHAATRRAIARISADAGAAGAQRRREVAGRGTAASEHNGSEALGRARGRAAEHGRARHAALGAGAARCT